MDPRKMTDEELVREHKNALIGEKNAKADGLTRQAKAFEKDKRAIRKEAKRRATPEEREEVRKRHGRWF